MCFSATASFTAAAVLSVGGIFAVLKSRSIPMLMFAVTPLFFAFQQALEGIVWITLMQGDNHSNLSKIGIYGFLFFAGAFWPIWISGCVYLLEDNKTRKKFLLIAFILGLLASTRILFRLMLHSHTAVIVDHHISYPMFALTYSSKSTWSIIEDIFLTGAYLVAVLGSLFMSSIKYMWIIGLIGLVGFIIAQVFYALQFGSVWCFFGAISTVVTYFIVVEYNKTHT